MIREGNSTEALGLRLRSPTWLYVGIIKCRCPLASPRKGVYKWEKLGYYTKTMRQCEICGKGSMMHGARKKLRGNYNPTVRTRRYPNLQKLTVMEGLRVDACTQCIRTVKKKEAEAQAK